MTEQDWLALVNQACLFWKGSEKCQGMDIHLHLWLLYLQDQGLPQAHSKAGLGSERVPGGCDVNEMKVKTEHDSVNMGHMETLPRCLCPCGGH